MWEVALFGAIRPAVAIDRAYITSDQLMSVGIAVLSVASIVGPGIFSAESQKAACLARRPEVWLPSDQWVR